MPTFLMDLTPPFLPSLYHQAPFSSGTYTLFGSNLVHHCLPSLARCSTIATRPSALSTHHYHCHHSSQLPVSAVVRLLRVLCISTHHIIPIIPPYSCPHRCLAMLLVHVSAPITVILLPFLPVLPTCLIVQLHFGHMHQHASPQLPPAFPWLCFGLSISVSALLILTSDVLTALVFVLCSLLLPCLLLVQFLSRFYHL